MESGACEGDLAWSLGPVKVTLRGVWACEGDLVWSLGPVKVTLAWNLGPVKVTLCGERVFADIIKV